MKALDAQVQLIRFFRSDAGERYSRGFTMSLRNSDQTQVGESYGQTLDQWQANRLDQCETYWVSGDMQTLVEHAAQTYPANEPLLRVDLPTPTGFVLFERSSYFTDRWGKKLGFQALAWWEATPLMTGKGDYGKYAGSGNGHVPGVEVAFYADPLDEEDEYNQDISLDYRKSQTSLALVHVGFWPYDETIDGTLLEAIERGYDEPAIDSAQQLMSYQKTFWRLIQQRIAHIDRRSPERHALRRAQRAGFLANTDEVKVVVLRKFKEQDQPDMPGEGNTVDWSHRWIVDGHWRNQYYSKAGIHRQIWIHPFVKGPEGLPILVKDKVYKWVR